MASNFSILILGAVAFQLLFHTCNCRTAEITVYYESLCPDCESFFIKQMEPNYKKFVGYVNWNLIPYGNARTTRYPNGTVKSITCQHREEECYGNTVQACVLRKESSPSVREEFCLCFMVNGSDDAAFQKCAAAYGIGYDTVKTCAKSREGLEILAEYGDIQREANPPIEAVPTLALDGKQLTPTETGKAFSNFCQFICDHLTAGKPNACNSCSQKTDPQVDLNKQN